MFHVRLNKYRSTWNWFTTNPQGGGFGSNYCGPRYIALARATHGIPVGASYQLTVNDRDLGVFSIKPDVASYSVSLSAGDL